MRVRSPLLVALVVVTVALLAVPVLGAVGDAPAATDASAAQAGDENETANGSESFGARIAAFMQANSADADRSVEEGMWAARYNASAETDRDDVVRSRMDRLDRRSERLRDRMADLQARYENGSIPRVAYVAQASRLTTELNALDESINQTERRARDVGVNTSRLDALREQTRDLEGQEVAALARNLSVVRPGERGPPANVGPGDRGPPGRSDERPGGPDVIDPPGNETDAPDRGPPDDRGPPGDRGPGGDLPVGDDANETLGNGSSPLDSGLTDGDGDPLDGTETDSPDDADGDDGQNGTDLPDTPDLPDGQNDTELSDAPDLPDDSNPTDGTDDADVNGTDDSDDSDDGLL